MGSQEQLQINSNKVIIHKHEAFSGMRKAGKIAAEILDYITDFVEPGISTAKLDELCNQKIIEKGAKSACLGYRGAANTIPYPKNICTSVNHVVCHGIPTESKILKEGDILNIDVTVIVDGWHGDTSRMYCVGKKIPLLAKRLVQTTHDCLIKGIEAVKPGAMLSDIGKAIQPFAEEQGYTVVKDFCGHGIGKKFHTFPSVLHYIYDDPAYDVELKEGMFFTIEPMINAGNYKTKMLSDGWTAVTKDRSLSAQFEHTIGVTKDGYEIFTRSPKGIFDPKLL